MLKTKHRNSKSVAEQEDKIKIITGKDLYGVTNALPKTVIHERDFVNPLHTEVLSVPYQKIVDANKLFVDEGL